MATSLNSLATKLQENVQLQETPVVLDSDDFKEFVLDGAKRFYVDLGYLGWTTEYNEEINALSRDLDLSQEEYVLKASEICFFNTIKKHWSTILGYSTNAITITFPQKPWENIKGQIESLEFRLSELFYKISAVGGGN